MRTAQSILPIKDVDLVGIFDNMCSYFYGSLTLITFEFACKSIYSFGETLEEESFFLRCCSLHFITVPCLQSNFWLIIIVYQLVLLVTNDEEGCSGE